MLHIARCGRHEEAAAPGFIDENRIVSAHYLPLRKMLERDCSDHGLAQDVAHDALIVTIQRLRSGALADPVAIGPYLRQTARYMLIGQFRRRARRDLALAQQAAMAANDGLEDAAFESRLADERRLELERRIDRLTVARDRQLLRRYLLRGESRSGICQALNLSAQQFDRVLSRAKSRLLSGTAARRAERRGPVAADRCAGSAGPADSHRSHAPVAGSLASA